MNQPVWVLCVFLLDHRCLHMCTGEHMCACVPVIWACGHVTMTMKYELECLHVYVCGECTHVCLLKCPHGCAYISVSGGMGPCVCVCVCVRAHACTCLLLPIPRLRPSPLTMPEHPSCITHEPISKQGSRSKGSSINKPSAGSLALIGCPCLPPC